MKPQRAAWGLGRWRATPGGSHLLRGWACGPQHLDCRLQRDAPFVPQDWVPKMRWTDQLSPYGVVKDKPGRLAHKREQADRFMSSGARGANH